MNWRWIRRGEPVPLLCWSGPAVLELTSEQPSFLSATHFTGAHLNIHVKIVSSQYSFHFSPLFLSANPIWGMKACACIKNTSHMIAGASGGGREAKCWGRTRAEETVLFFIPLKAPKSSTFIMWYCEERRDRQTEESLSLKTETDVLFTFVSWPRFTKKQRQACAWSATAFCFSFLSYFFSPPQVPLLMPLSQRDTSPSWRLYWREFKCSEDIKLQKVFFFFFFFEWIAAAQRASENIQGYLSRSAFMWRQI